MASQLKLKLALCMAVIVVLTGCATPKWQTDRETPLSELAVVHRKLDPNANLVTVNGETKGFGFIFEIRLPPGEHIIGFVPHPLMYGLIASDPNEPKDSYFAHLIHYIKFDGKAGHVYDVERSHGRQTKAGTTPFLIEIVDRANGQPASIPLGNFYNAPTVKSKQ